MNPLASSYIKRLSEVSADLQSLYRELASVLVVEHKAKIDTWTSVQGSIQERNKWADANAIDFTEDVIKLKGDIQALEAEERYLTLVIQQYPPESPTIMSTVGTHGVDGP